MPFGSYSSVTGTEAGDLQVGDSSAGVGPIDVTGVCTQSEGGGECFRQVTLPRHTLSLRCLAPGHQETLDKGML